MTPENDKETFLLKLNKLFTNGKMTYNDRHELQQLHDADILSKVKENTQIMINEQEKLLKEKDKEIKILKGGGLI